MNLKKYRLWLLKNLEPHQLTKNKISLLNKFFITLILISIWLQVIQTDEIVFQKYLKEFFYIDVFFATIFSLEIAARIWCYGLYEEYKGKNAYKKIFNNPHIIIDIMTLIPYYLTIGEPSWYWGVLRMTRFLCFFRYPNITKSFKLIFKAIYKKRYELFVTLMIFSFLMLISSTLIFLAEKDMQPEEFGTISNSIWWAIVTLTTVGYGDVYPITDMGRFFASVTMLLGILAFAMPTGILAASFNLAFQEKFESKVLKDLREEKKVLKELSEEIGHLEEEIEDKGKKFL